MRIAILSGASSIHTIRWANGLQAAGHQIHVLSQHAPVEEFVRGVKLHMFPFRGAKGYFGIVRAVTKLLQKIDFDIVSAHYASGYGTTARLVDFHPYVLSVWGSDVYDFPRRSPLHRWLVRKNIMAADCVASTSHCMAQQTQRVAPDVKNIAVTPFGVDMSAFHAAAPKIEQNGYIVIGTVKSMAQKYGVDTLIEGFSALVKRMEHSAPVLAGKLKLRLVGDGPQTEELRDLAASLGLTPRVDFVGRVPHAQVPSELAKLDIYVALSRSESFGVAILEAGAACRPVIVSDAGGLPEVTVNGKTGIVVPREDPSSAAEAMEALVLDAELRKTMGLAGRRHVEQHYSWTASVDIMVSVLRDTVAAHKARSA